MHLVSLFIIFIDCFALTHLLVTDSTLKP